MGPDLLGLVVALAVIPGLLLVLPSGRRPDRAPEIVAFWPIYRAAKGRCPGLHLEVEEGAAPGALVMCVRSDDPGALEKLATKSRGAGFDVQFDGDLLRVREARREQRL